jgi:hypothetical protein
MKILLIALPSIHFIRWAENLSNTSHEFYWFDVIGHQYFDATLDIRKMLDWEQQKFPYYKGKDLPPNQLGWIYERVRKFLETTTDAYWDKVIEDIEPDVVHSFEMQVCAYPLLNTMKKHTNIPWIYSCWGSDMFYYQHLPEHLPEIKQVLLHIHYLHTDCQRDYDLAVQLGFRGKHTGVIPGAGGYALANYTAKQVDMQNRNIILVKGYEDAVGRALIVIKALENLIQKIASYQVVVFSAHQPVIDYVVQRKLPFQLYEGYSLSNSAVLELMGKAFLYIGNSTSDGMPNTLLEAIVMGAFPIQSNPGGVTAEIIEHGKNGLLIEDAEDIEALQKLIEAAVNDKQRWQIAYEMNMKIAVERLDFEVNRQKIIAIYETAKISYELD